MIHAREFVEAARARGFEWYAGVPCSFLTPFINYVISDASLNYISAANEGDAVAAAAGAAIGGKRAVAMMQNSGLGNAVSPLTSLTHTFAIPLLIVCTHRGAPGVSDEPQHELMGAITEKIFETMAIPWATFPQTSNAIESALDNADEQTLGISRPYALIMQKGTCEPFFLDKNSHFPRTVAVAIGGLGHQRETHERPTRHAVLQAVVEHVNGQTTVVIASTGFIGRELYAVSDRPNHFYMVGSMGCASSLGLGLALARPDLKVVVIDGDGAALMRLGNFATIGAYRPNNFVHLLLDNEVHDSTGAQSTVSASIDFALLAAGCGYGRVMRSDDPDEISELLTGSDTPGPAFMHMKIRAGTMADLPRPTVKPEAVLKRLMRHIGSI